MDVPALEQELRQMNRLLRARRNTNTRYDELYKKFVQVARGDTAEAVKEALQRWRKVDRDISRGMERVSKETEEFLRRIEQLDSGADFSRTGRTGLVGPASSLGRPASDVGSRRRLTDLHRSTPQTNPAGEGNRQSQEDTLTSVERASNVSRPTTALIMGGTGNPLPDRKYVEDINTKYIQPLFPNASHVGLYTPEQFWPVTPKLGNLTFNQSVAEGLTRLTNTVNSELASNNNAAAFGYSQSATVINNYINSLIASGSPNVDNLSFAMVGAPNNPDGGLLSRFPGFYVPFLEVPFNGATPRNNPYQTDVYTIQYDGFAHAPRYPLNILSSANALAGLITEHHKYPNLTPDQIASAVQLPTSPDGTGNTRYHMILSQNLPLLQPIRSIPYVGPPIADLFQPALRPLVDMGYSDYGPGRDYADIPTPSGLLHIPHPLNTAYYLGKGLLQGPYGAIAGIGVRAGLLSPDWLPNTYPYVPSLNPGLNVYLGQPQVTALSLASRGIGDLLTMMAPPQPAPRIPLELLAQAVATLASRAGNSGDSENIENEPPDVEGADQDEQQGDSKANTPGQEAVRDLVSMSEQQWSTPSAIPGTAVRIA